MRRALLALLLAAAPLLAGDRLYDYREIMLPNGLRVITHEDFSCPIVAVQVWYHVGSKDEDPERQGFAHMFEHMMFRGTERVADKEFDRLLKRVGGDNNAFTSFDNTTYVCELPASQLELVLWLEAERMIFLRVDEEGFATERKVVEEERRQSNLNPPYGTVPEKAVAEIFKVHPYRWMPIGKIPHLRKATIEELEAFWARYYVPSNAVLVIAGAVKHEEAQALARKHLGWIPRCPAPPRVTAREPAQDGPRKLVIQEPKGPVPIVALAFRTVPLADADAIPLDLCLAILGEGESSRLHQDLVKERKLAQVTLAEHFTLEQDGVAVLGAVLAPLGADEDKALAALQEHVSRLAAEPVGERELGKARNRRLRGEVGGTATVAGKASELGAAALLEGDANRVNERLDRIRAVTAADVQRVAKTYLVEKARTTIVVKPSLAGAVLGGLLGKGGDEDEGAPPAKEPEGNRVAPRTGAKAEIGRPEGLPAAAPARPLAPPRLPVFPQQAKALGNALRVVVVPHHEVPLVTVMVTLHFGGWTEPKPGVASMALDQLTKGTTSRTAKQLAEELEFHAISLRGSATMDGATVTATCLREKLPLAMKYLAEVVLTPTFPKDELEIARSQLVTALTQEAAEPDALARKHFRRQLFGAHPYGRRITGEIDDVKAIGRDDLAGWWRTWAAWPAALYIAGDVEAGEAFALAEAHFGKIPEESPVPPPPSPPPPARTETRIVLVDLPGSEQSEIRAGHLSITPHHADWHAAQVLAQILGGDFLSRLNDSLRVEKGLTYGAYGGIRAERFAGTLGITTSTKTPRTAETVRALLDVLETMRATEPTAEELGTTTSYLAGRYAGRWETPESMAAELWFLESNGLPRDFHQSAIEAYAKATAKDVQRLAKEHLDPAHLLIVVVGDAARVKEDLAKIAPVEVVKP